MPKSSPIRISVLNPPKGFVLKVPPKTKFKSETSYAVLELVVVAKPRTHAAATRKAESLRKANPDKKYWVNIIEVSTPV